MNAKKIVVIGSCNTDMVVKTEKMPLPGETVIGSSFLMNPGGKGANQAVAAARLGGDVTFLCKVGGDIFGEQSIAGYKRDNINTDSIIVSPSEPTGVALITVDGKGENSIVVSPGANNSLSTSDIEAARELITSADIVVMQLEIPIESVAYAAKMAHESGVKVILNPAPAPLGGFPSEILQYIDLLIPNMTEASTITGEAVSGEADAPSVAKTLCQMGVGSVIITLGKEGAYTLHSGEGFMTKAFKVEAMDTTAAGDTFCGALAVGLSKESELSSEVVRFACAASALSVTKMGAQSSAPTKEMVEEFITNKR